MSFQWHLLFTSYVILDKLLSSLPLGYLIRKVDIIIVTTLWRLCEVMHIYILNTVLGTRVFNKC